MYLTTLAGGTKVDLNHAIVRAGMDGSDATAIVSGLALPCGIAYEFKSDRIYWTDDTNKKIQSSNGHGGDVQTIVALHWPMDPMGLPFLGTKFTFAITGPKWYKV